jgi:hypothetical protein
LFHQTQQLRIFGQAGRGLPDPLFLKRDHLRKKPLGNVPVQAERVIDEEKITVRNGFQFSDDLPDRPDAKFFSQDMSGRAKLAVERAASVCQKADMASRPGGAAKSVLVNGKRVSVEGDSLKLGPLSARAEVICRY